MKWLFSLSKKWRQRQREIDAQVLWPALLDRCGGDPVLFINLACRHASTDPAWKVHEEWKVAPEQPGRWLGRRMKEAKDGAP